MDYLCCIPTKCRGSQFRRQWSAAELQRRLSAAGSRVIATVAHPGLVSSSIYDQASRFANLFVRVLSQSTEKGALPVLYAAVADIPGNSFVGPKYLLHMRGALVLIKSSTVAQNADLARRLWIVSEQLTGVQFALQPDRGQGKKLSS
jgi:hypothetical protein